MAEVVYALCALTSAACAFLLLRNYRSATSRLLLWSGVCFIVLALNNILLFMDLVIVTEIDLSAGRDLTAFGGVAVLVFGLVWESR